MSRWTFFRQPRSPRPDAEGPRTRARGLEDVAHQVSHFTADPHVDVHAVERVARSYARRGLDLERLMSDIDEMGSAFGLELPAERSLILERSALAWSDAYLAAYGADNPLPPSDDSPVRDRAEAVVHAVTAVGGGLCLAVTWPALNDGGSDDERAEVAARLLVSVFPDVELIRGDHPRTLLAIRPGVADNTVLADLRATLAEHFEKVQLTVERLGSDPSAALAAVDRMAA